MTIKARIWQQDGTVGFVTGTQDADAAAAALVAELTDELRSGDLYDHRVDTMELEPERLATAMVSGVVPKLEVGRIVPDPEYGWLWWPNLHPDRPGAFFALTYDLNHQVPVEGFECRHDFSDGYPEPATSRCIWCLATEQ